jgi:hypothetical protein
MTDRYFRRLALCAITTATACTSAGPPADTRSPAPAASPAKLAQTSLRARAIAAARKAHRPMPQAQAKPPTARGVALDETMQVLSGGGPVMTAPKIVPILFPGDPYDTQVRDFLPKLASSSYWKAAVSEYGVGAATVLPPYVPTDPPPTSDGTGDWLTGLLASPSSGLPPPDDNTVYAIVFPAGWDAVDGACVVFGADHFYAYMPSGQGVAYTQNPVCPNGYLGTTGVGQVTNALSHEIIESVTDPYVTAYIYNDWAISGWGSAAEGGPFAELADVCEFQPDASYVDPQIGYLVQRIWSNASEAAGHDPCLPHLPTRPVYFNTEALLTDGTQIYPNGYTRGISIPPGREATIAVRLLADGPMPEWTLAADEEPNPHLSPDIYNELSFRWDDPHGRAGDVRHLTIHRAPNPDDGGASPQVFLRVAITSTSGATINKSWLVVGTE